VSDSHKKKTIKGSDQLEALNQQVLDLTEALQRERADSVNVRRRAEEDRLKMSSYFKATVIKELLPFIDNFDRALKHIPVDDKILVNKQLEDWLKGLSGVNKQLWQALETIGVKRIETIGQVFNPEVHEAVQMDDSGKGLNEVVVEEFASGFTLEGEVLRHAMVKVAMQ
jgi:molecular chaperone GrpE